MQEMGKSQKFHQINICQIHMWILPPSINRERFVFTITQLSTFSGAELCDCYLGCQQSISRPRRWSTLGGSSLLCWGKKKWQNFVFFIRSAIYFFANVESDDSKEFDMITKAFVNKFSKLITNSTKKAHPEKSRDENIKLIPSRKIPGSRDFAKIPSRKSRD